MTSSWAAAPSSAVPGARRPPDRVGPQVVLVEVQGDLDAARVPRVRALLEDAAGLRPQQLVVDLSGCGFLDASGLSALLEVHRRLARVGAVMTLRGCSPRILRLLSLTGLQRVFDLDPACQDRQGETSSGSSARAVRAGVTNL
jgi:anti-anti-sigma factor